MAALHTLPYWIFDMDGTLTVQNHNFDEMKRALEVPEEEAHDLLRYIRSLPEKEAKEKHAWLLNYGLTKAADSKPNRGAIELLDYLTHEKGAKLGLLTRNNRNVALKTLEAIDALKYFEMDDILGRDEAAPKPDPDGILHLLNRWNGTPQKAVMVGDFTFDLNCGRNAGTSTILVNQAENFWPEITDFYFTDCAAILEHLTNS